MTTAREQELRAAGRPAAACPECGRVFDPRTSYAGHPASRARGACSEECRDLLRNAHRREVYRATVEPRGIRRMRREEARGQLPIPDAVDLPPQPTARFVDDADAGSIPVDVTVTTP